MKKFKWRMAGVSFDAVGGSMMRFRCEDFPGVTITELEQRDTEIYQGSIWQHDFIVEDRDSGYKKTFGGPIAAKRFVERGKLEKAIKAKQLALAEGGSLDD